jgi:hypothetical protein
MTPLKEHDPVTPTAPSSSASPLSRSGFDPEPLSVDEVELTRADVVLQAELIRGRLEAHGIPVRLTDTHTAGLAPHLGVAIGGIRVIVPRDDLEAARAILDAPPIDDDSAADDDIDDGATTLPTQGPAEVAARWALWSALLAFVIPVGGQVGSLFMMWRALNIGAPLGAPLSGAGYRVIAVAALVDVVAAATWAVLLWS